jgi:hypothetical protein
MVSLPGASGARQRELLIREGIRFRDGRVDMEEYGWSPEQLSALQKRRSKDLRAGPRKPGAKGRK